MSELVSNRAKMMHVNHSVSDRKHGLSVCVVNVKWTSTFSGVWLLLGFIVVVFKLCKRFRGVSEIVKFRITMLLV